MSDDNIVIYQALIDAQSSNQPVALVTVVDAQGSTPRRAGSKMLVYDDGSSVGTIGGGTMEARVIEEAQAALHDGKTRMKSYVLNNPADGDPGICGGTVQLFIEPIGIVPTLLVIGGGHCGRELAQLGKWMNYRVILCDDRPEFANEDYLPGMDAYVVCQPGDITDHAEINSQTYVAAVTRGLPVDIDLLPALLRTKAPYIGVIGSRRRWALTVKELQAQRGLTEDEISRVRAPIGLEIQAETPKEIAISIMSEIIMVCHGGTGQPMFQADNLDTANVEQI